jgi:DNA-binding NtrC family response regulator
MRRSKQDPIVLIVEEDEQIRESLSDMLTERGYSTVGVRTGSHGMTLIDRGLQPRVIVLDPFTANGARQFKVDLAARTSFARVPVIVGPGGLAAGVEHTLRHEHHLPPPLDVQELLRLVQGYCRPWV